MTGHMMGAAGAFEAFATVKSIAEQCVPGTINYRDVRPRVRHLGRVRDAADGHPLRPLNNIGLGGHNGAVIFKRYDGD